MILYGLLFVMNILVFLTTDHTPIAVIAYLLAICCSWMFGIKLRESLRSKMTGGIITDNGDGTFDISAGKCTIGVVLERPTPEFIYIDGNGNITEAPDPSEYDEGCGIPVIRNGQYVCDRVFLKDNGELVVKPE